MTESVNLNKSSRPDFFATATLAWGDELPDWVLLLAEEVQRTSLVAVGKRLRLSGSLISQVISRKYNGNMNAISEKVRGAFMGLEVICPVRGEIPRDYCLAEQKMKLAATSSIRMRVYHACRAGCPNSRLKGV